LTHNDVQTRAIGQRGVDERLAEIDAAARGLQHPFDEVADRGIRQRQRDALRDSPARDEDAVGGVDPQLLDRRVVEISLERPVAGDRGEHVADAGGLVVDRGEAAREGEVVVAPHLGQGDGCRDVRLARRIGPFGAEPLPHALGHSSGGSGDRSHRRIIASRAPRAVELSTGLRICRRIVVHLIARSPTSRMSSRNRRGVCPTAVAQAPQ